MRSIHPKSLFAPRRIATFVATLLIGSQATSEAQAQFPPIDTGRIPPCRDADLEDPSTVARITADGRFVVFTSEANIDDLASGARQQVYRWDRNTDTVVLVSRNTSGSPSIWDCFYPSISNDGQCIVFHTAGILDPADGFAGLDVYLRDLTDPMAPLTRILSQACDGMGGLMPANGESRNAFISGNGKFVAFMSKATNFDSADTDVLSDVYCLEIDVVNECPQVVSLDNSNPDQTSAVTHFTTGEDSPSVDGVGGVIDDSGNFVLFHGNPTDWDTGPGECGAVNCLNPGGVRQVYLRDVLLSKTFRVSRFSNGTTFSPGNAGSRRASINANATSVAFSSFATNFPGDTDTFEDIFCIFVPDELNDLLANARRASAPLGPLGTDSNGNSTRPMVADSGSRIAFESVASNLVVGDTNGKTDVFVATDVDPLFVIDRYSVSASGAEGDDHSKHPDITAFAETLAVEWTVGVVYHSDATNLDPGDNNGVTDIFATIRRLRLRRGDANDDDLVDS